MLVRLPTRLYGLHIVKLAPVYRIRIIAKDGIQRERGTRTHVGTDAVGAVDRQGVHRSWTPGPQLGISSAITGKRWHWRPVNKML